MPDVAPTAGEFPSEDGGSEPAPPAIPVVSPPPASVPDGSEVPPVDAPKQVVVAVETPFYVQGFVDGKLTIDRLGVLVDRDVVESLVTLASAQGIGLKVGK